MIKIARIRNWWHSSIPLPERPEKFRSRFGLLNSLLPLLLLLMG